MEKKFLGFALIVILAALMSSCFYGGSRPYYDYKYRHPYAYSRPPVRIVPPPVIIAPQYGYGRSYGNKHRSHHGRRRR